MANKYHREAMKEQKQSREENYERGMKNLAGTPSQTTGTFNVRVRKFRKALDR